MMGIDTSGLADQRRAPRTTCKVCWCSIFATDDTSWVTHPNPGLAHTVCAEEYRTQHQPQPEEQ